MSTGPKQLSMPMFEDLADSPMSMSSLGDFPVKTFQWQGTALAWKANALVYGGSSIDLLARLDHEQFYWKTFEQLLMTDAVEQRLLRRLPDWGMSQHGELYRLLMQALPTSATDGFVWPTPNAEDYYSRQTPKNEKIHVTISGTLKLDTGHKSHVRLSETVKYYENKKDWHTVIANDALKWGNIEQKPENGLSAQVKYFEQAAGKELSPKWVGMLMGFPEGWTDID